MDTALCTVAHNVCECAVRKLLRATLMGRAMRGGEEGGGRTSALLPYQALDVLFQTFFNVRNIEPQYTEAQLCSLHDLQQLLLSCQLGD